jgi:hypothetical protein
MTCPQCGGTLVPHPAPDKRSLVRTMVANGSKAEYAASKADAMLEKEAESGVVHTCTSCRYTDRVKPSAPTGRKEKAA